MASSRDGSSFWSRLRSRPNVDSRSISSCPVLPMDEFTGVPPAQGRTSRSAESLVYDVNDMDRFFTDWVRLTNRNREQEKRPPECIDTAAVLRKCRKVVYKPRSSLWGKAKVEAGHSECAVCLEKLVAKEKLFTLPCKHQFHVDCLTPWIKCNHACCPCCRADILKGSKVDENASSSITGRSGTANFQQWRNSRGRDFRIEIAASNQGYSRRRSLRNQSVAVLTTLGGP